MTEATHYGRRYLVARCYPLEKKYSIHSRLGIMDHARIGREQRQHLVIEDKERHIGDKTGNCCSGKAYPEDTLTTGELPGSIILTNKRDASTAEREQHEITVSIKVLGK